MSISCFSWYPRFPYVEALCLKATLNWIIEYNMPRVLVEMDAKLMVDGFHSFAMDMSEFGAIMQCCQRLTRLCHDVSISFMPKREFSSTFYETFLPPRCMLWR